MHLDSLTKTGHTLQKSGHERTQHVGQKTRKEVTEEVTEEVTKKPKESEEVTKKPKESEEVTANKAKVDDAKVAKVEDVKIEYTPTYPPRSPCFVPQQDGCLRTHRISQRLAAVSDKISKYVVDGLRDYFSGQEGHNYEYQVRMARDAAVSL